MAWALANGHKQSEKQHKGDGVDADIEVKCSPRFLERISG